MHNNSGFTIFEFLIVSAILLFAIGAIVVFQNDFLSANSFLQKAFLREAQAKSVFRQITKETREAIISSTGEYPIAEADSDSFIFFSNIDKDALIERIHYYVDGTDLKRSITKPSGAILSYAVPPAEEYTTIVLRDLVASTTAPVFSYFDGSYAGTTTPMQAPIDVGAVRHIKINFILDDDPMQTPPTLYISTEINIRNLKDNY